MSCDWNIKCLDCDDVHTFSDANHCDDLMLKLIRHADSIAAVADLMAETIGDVSFGTYYGAIDTAWFRQHLGHNLMPIDEYGRLLDQCREYVNCGECKTRHRCGLKLNHEGPHTRSPS